MSKKIRLGYDILSKRAIETESGVNIDDALRSISSYQKVPGTGSDNHPDVPRPSTKVLYIVKVASAGQPDTYKEWIWTQPSDGPGYWECTGDTTQDLSGYALKSEMSVEPGTGADSDKTTITLKEGTSATVLTAHQDLSGYALKSEMSVEQGTGSDADKTTITLKEGTSATVLTAHQDISGKADRDADAVSGNLAEFDANGNPVDSGKTLDDIMLKADVALPLKIDNGILTNNGVGLTVTGNNAWAEGSYTTASGNSSHAEGDYTFATGAKSHAEGENTTASGTRAHAEGMSTTASADKAHAEGETTTASATRSHAEGWLSIASEVAAHAEGYSTTANGPYSHAQGQGTVASGTASCAMGMYNDDSAGLLVVGNGTSASERADCFKVDSSGDTHVMLGNTLTNLNEYLTPGDDDLITVTIPNTALVGGRLYRTCIIGSQEWFAENLDWKFPGCTIGDPYSTEPGARANYYDNDEATYGENGNKYGLLYNWYCVSILNSLLNDGWRVPSDYDWEALKNRESSTIGKQLKATSGWNADNGTDVFGFRGLPSGTYDGTFTGIGDTARFMSSTDHGSYLYEYSLNDSNVFSYPDVLYYVGGISYAKERTIRLVRTVV